MSLAHWSENGAGTNGGGAAVVLLLVLGPCVVFVYADAGGHVHAWQSHPYLGTVHESCIFICDRQEYVTDSNRQTTM